MLEAWNLYQAPPQEEEAAQTLRGRWEQLDLTPILVCARARLSLPTLYKLNRKEPCSKHSVKAVCQALHISAAQYAAYAPGE